LLLLQGVLLPSVALAQAATYDVPNGRFFVSPLVAPRGYLVGNAAGIPMLDEYQRVGGASLGAPTSRRFVWRGQIAQAFERGALVWESEAARASVRPLAEVGQPPAPALTPEPPMRLTGEAERKPWSGWWWPANDFVPGPRLIDSNGPLAKYDLLVESMGRPDPGTLEWEQSELYFREFGWAGHCNGWAAAALLEPEPTSTRELGGLTFGVADMKGLLSSYHFADAALWAAGGESAPATPAEFHRAITTWIGGERRGLIVTFRLDGEEVWSYPAYRFESVIGPDPAEVDLWHVRTRLWFADNNVASGFVGLNHWPSDEGKLFEYTVVGDPARGVGGDWGPNNQSGFGRPYMAWFPDASRRNVDRQLASPMLEYSILSAITRGGPDKAVFGPRVPAPSAPVFAPPRRR
jgi:hypothetical protein